jgi:hypothetical protein
MRPRSTALTSPCSHDSFRSRVATAQGNSRTLGHRGELRPEAAGSDSVVGQKRRADVDLTMSPEEFFVLDHVDIVVQSSCGSLSWSSR